jgi:hypothetical protein
MRAVEVLSRETSQRRDVASEVLQLARRWGGIISSGTGEQFGQQSAASDPSSESGRFMAFLLEVFPQFLPDPGFHALLDEFQNGNERSRTACTWLLANGIQGVVGETQYPDQQSKSITWLSNEAKLQHEQLIPALLEQLQRFSETSKDKTVIGLAFSTSIPLAALNGESIDMYPSLTRYARETFQHRYEQFKLGSNPNERMTSTTPVPALLLIGLELAIADAQANEVDPKLFQYFFWELFEGSFTGIESTYVPRFEKAIEWLFQHHNDIAIGEVEQRLAWLISKAVEDTPSAAGGLGSMGMAAGGMGMAAGGMGGYASQQQFLELQSFDNPQSAWGLILIQYAKTKQPASQGLELLTGIRDTLTSKYTRGGMGGLRREDSPLERSIELLSYR